MLGRQFARYREAIDRSVIDRGFWERFVRARLFSARGEGARVGRGYFLEAGVQSREVSRSIRVLSR